MSDPAPIPNWGALQRDIYTSSFDAAVAAGTARPLVVPYSLFGSFGLPILYLSIPHTNRPWLYRARFLVLAAMLALHVQTITSGTSSSNMAAAYGTGLMISFSTLWGLTLLVWTKPQFEAARVEKRRRRTARRPGSKPEWTEKKEGDREEAGGVGEKGQAAEVNGIRNRKQGHPAAQTNGFTRDKSQESQESQNGHASSEKIQASEVCYERGNPQGNAPDESIAAVLDEYEYYWQPFPIEGSFLQRLSWSFDLVTAFRGSGWNWTVPCIPHFKAPEDPQAHEVIDLESMPVMTRTGYMRSTTYRGFLANRIFHMTWAYLVLDFCSVAMMKDPYFVSGPETTHTLPPYLAALHPLLLELYRSILFLGGVLGALFLILNFDQVLRCLVLGRACFGVRGDLWQYPSLFGSLDNVLDRGLAGFWGGWWHQSFRVAFTAPTVFLVRRGSLDADPRAWKTQLVGAFVAFLSSGLLHALGGVTAIPDLPKVWPPIVFFLLSFVGIVLQQSLCWASRPWMARLPRAWRQAGNVAFVVVWLHLTRWGFLDDMCRSGVWLFEPVPVSPLRALGFGHAGDSWWRWDAHHLPSWHWGRHWWETGLSI